MFFSPTPSLHRSVTKPLAISLLVLLLGMSGLQAADNAARWPQRPVRFIVSTAAGGASDIMARLLAERLQSLWGEQILVENKTGGAAVIATESVVRSTPDAHVMGLLASSFVVTAALRNDLPYDIRRDLRAVTHIGSAPAVLVARGAMGVVDVMAAAVAAQAVMLELVVQEA